MATSVAAKKVKIFLSYCWSDKVEAEQIYQDLTGLGIDIKKDNHELKYKDNIKHFMDSIRDTNYAILLISDSYLKSINCMYEISNLLKEKKFNKKVLPVIIKGTNIYSTIDRINYVRYWKEKKQELDKELTGLDPIDSIEILKDIKHVSNVVALIDLFIKQISDMLTISYDKLTAEGYRPLLKAIGAVDLTWAFELLAITQLKDFEKRELAFDEYIVKHKPNSYYHGLKGDTYSKSQKPDRARLNFEQAINLNPKDYAALNNLGWLYYKDYKDYNKAKYYYEKAIEVRPKNSVARLNLGTILSHHLGQKDAAKEQYELILQYEPENFKAHSNLANYYRQAGENSNLEKAWEHLNRSLVIEPNFADGLLTKANMLKLEGKIDEGNKIYEKLLEMDLREDILEVVKLALTSNKF